jgi:hypothetical protein
LLAPTAVLVDEERGVVLLRALVDGEAVEIEFDAKQAEELAIGLAAAARRVGGEQIPRMVWE